MFFLSSQLVALMENSMAFDEGTSEHTLYFHLVANSLDLFKNIFLKKFNGFLNCAISVLFDL